MQNVNFVKMGVELAEHLKNDGDIKNFCQDIYGKDISILVGDATDSFRPTEDDAPYIYMWGFSKKEGTTIKDPAEYQCNFGCGVSDKDNSETESGIVIAGGFERVSELMNLVQHSLFGFNEGCKPPDVVEADVMGAIESSNTHWAGNITATWKVPQMLGMGEITDF